MAATTSTFSSAGPSIPQPRLNARSVPQGDGSRTGTAVGDMVDVLTAAYGERLDRVGANLYRDGRDSVAWHGYLLVMGGSCQRTWQHSVPKVRHAGPRMSITFRSIDLYRR